MAIIKPKGVRIAVERVKKSSILSANSDNNYDYEKYKFKVAAIGELVEDKSVLDKIIVKQQNQGIEIQFEGKDYIIIREDDILAVL